MAYSGIGGQAVMEGVMMKHQDTYAVAVRKPDHEIIVETKNYSGICKNKILRNLIFVRGIINFVESMVLGMSTLRFSVHFQLHFLRIIIRRTAKNLKMKHLRLE